MRSLGALLLCLSAWSAGAAPRPCTNRGVEIQVLGSGGPELQDKRASSSYLIKSDGRALILIDAGGGAALRFGESDARMTDLKYVLFSHLHVDHSADFAALIKSSYFEDRSQPLIVYGPSGNAGFPATTQFVADLFDRRRGAYHYLGDYLQGREGGYRLDVHDVAPTAHGMHRVLASDGIVLYAATVVHGAVPALAWRIETGDRVFALSGDTDGRNGNLQLVAHGADVFIAHNAVPQGTQGSLLGLHMPPSVIGEVAAAAGVKQLVLSHRMLRTLGQEQQTQAAIAEKYAGALAFADDLDCYR